MTNEIAPITRWILKNLRRNNNVSILKGFVFKGVTKTEYDYSNRDWVRQLHLTGNVRVPNFRQRAF